MNLNECVRYWGQNRTDQDAIIFGDTTLTWGQVDKEVDSLAYGLKAQGVRKGQRVGILMRNRIETAISMLASLRIGAICAPLNFRLIGRELAEMVEDCSPSVILAEADLAPLLDQAAGVVDYRLFTTDSDGPASYEKLKVQADEKPDEDIDEDDVAFICYTSGTTGTQKGAMLTHRNISSVAEATCVAHNITGRTRALAAAPLVYTGSGISVFMQLVVYPGSTMVLMDQFDPVLGLEAMTRHQVSSITTVPVIWEQIALSPGFEEAEFAEFELAGAGGAPVSIDLLHRYRERGLPLTQVYGCTEASGLIATLQQVDAMRKPGFAGLPLLGTEIRIGSLTGGTALPNEVGEVMVKGPHVMKGYWNKPEATANVIDEDGWLKTGDLGLQDKEGFLQLVDRSKDMLISGGLNVYPAEIERALSQTPGVLELAAIGVPHEKWGEVPMIILRIEGDQDEVLSRLAQKARESLAKFKRPTYAVIREEGIPRTFSGKLAKPKLRSLYPTVPDEAVPVPQYG